MNEIFYNVPDNVIKNVKEYFTEHLPNYEVIRVVRKSKYETDWYLFMVIGRKKDDPYNMGRYTVWSSWNETTKSLNFGHYGIDTEAKALEVLSDLFVY